MELSRLHRFYAGLQQLPSATPELVATEICSSLLATFDLSAVSMYTYAPVAETLRLRGLAGLPPSDAPRLELSLESLAGSAIGSADGSEFYEDLRDPLYIDQTLRERHNLQNLLVTSVTDVSGSGVSQTIGVLCAYFRSVNEAAAAREHLTQASSTIGRAYMDSIRQERLALREDIVKTAVHERDLSRLARAAIKVFRESLNVGAAAIWLHDEHRKLIYPVAESNIGDSRFGSRFFNTQSPAKNSLLYCFENSAAIQRLAGASDWQELVDASSAGRALDLDPTLVQLKQRAALMIPIVQPTPWNSPIQRSLGVVRLEEPLPVDEVTTASHARNPLQLNFTWEDREKAAFVAEILGVLAGIHLRVGDYESDYERRLHMAKARLTSAIGNLRVLEKTPEITPRRESYYLLSDAITLVDDLLQQILRSGFHTQSLTFETIHLTEIAGSMPRFIDHEAAMNSRDVKLNRLNEAGFRQVRPFRSDRRAILLILRNLVQNAVKYADPYKTDAEIFMWAKGSQKSLSVFVGDKGIGITDADAPYIFFDGYRGKRAAEVNSEGVGRGLSDCKEIARSLGGELLLRDQGIAIGSMTTFELRLPYGEENR